MEIVVKNITVNCIDEGEGTPIIFLQGWGTGIELYKKLINKVAEKNRIITLDLPGFGKTKEPEIAWSVDDYTDFILEFIKMKKLDNLVLMGHSFGGRIIIKLMSRKRDFKVEKIVLLDSAGIKAKTTFRKQARQKWFRVCKKIFSTKIGKKISPDMVEKMQRKHGSADYRKASPVMRQVLVKAVNEDLTGLLSNIDVPTLLVWGEQDNATPLSDAYLMERLIPDSGLVVIKNTGHYSFLEDFYTFSRVIDSFLE